MIKYRNQLLIISLIYLSIFLAISISPYVIVDTYYQGAVSRILFFKSLVYTNLIVPFSINTIYLFYIISQYVFSKDENKGS